MMNKSKRKWKKRIFWHFLFLRSMIKEQDRLKFWQRLEQRNLDKQNQWFAWLTCCAFVCSPYFFFSWLKQCKKGTFFFLFLSFLYSCLFFLSPKVWPRWHMIHLLLLAKWILIKANNINISCTNIFSSRLFL